MVGDRARQLFQPRDHDMECAVEAALQLNRARARRDIPDAFREDRRSQQRGCRRAIADHAACAFRGLSNDLRTEVFLVVRQLELFGDRDPVVTDDGASPRFLDEHTFRLRT